MDCIGYLLVCASLLVAVQCQELEFFSNPSNVVAGSTDSLNVTCKAPDLSKDTNLIILMQVHQLVNDSNTLVASCRMTGCDVHIQNDRTSAKGELNGGEGTFLTVTITSPVKEDTGKYRCRFAFLDMASFKFSMLNKSIDITFTEPDEPTPEPVVPGDCSCDQVWTEVKDLRETLIAENTKLKNMVMSYDDSCRVSFSAKIEGRLGPEIRSNSILIFDSIASNKGDAYDKTNGIFTVPCTGQYFIQLTMRTFQQKDAGYVDGTLEVNEKGVARTSVFTDDHMDHYEQASNGLVLGLQKGDTVQVKVQTDSGGKIFGDVFSIFTGFFISP